MSYETNEFNLHIETHSSYYDGDSTFTCTVTFPLYDRGNGKETAKVTYEAEHDDDVKEQILKDIWAYIEDPEEWTREYIKTGSDVFLKLRELDQSIQSEKQDIENKRKSIKWAEEHLQKLEKQKQSLLAQQKPE